MGLYTNLLCHIPLEYLSLTHTHTQTQQSLSHSLTFNICFTTEMHISTALPAGAALGVPHCCEFISGDGCSTIIAYIIWGNLADWTTSIHHILLTFSLWFTPTSPAALFLLTPSLWPYLAILFDLVLLYPSWLFGSHCSSHFPHFSLSPPSLMFFAHVLHLYPMHILPSSFTFCFSVYLEESLCGVCLTDIEPCGMP